MSERLVTVVPEAGLHARPATQFVETAREYEAAVTVGRPDDDPVSAETMLGVTGLGVASGEQVRLIADGPDAEEALDALEAVLTTPEGESADENASDTASSSGGGEGTNSGADPPDSAGGVD